MSDAFDFAVLLGQDRADFDFGPIESDTTVKWIGVIYRERFGPRLRLGLQGGYSYLTQTDNPLTAGKELTGYHAGLLIDVALLQTRNFNLYFAANYLYRRVDDDTGGQRVELTWHDMRTRLGLAVRLGDTVRLHTGALYGRLDGEERDLGIIDRTVDFERTARPGVFLGVDLNVDNRGGSIGIEACSGLTRGGEIYFQRLF